MNKYEDDAQLKALDAEIDFMEWEIKNREDSIDSIAESVCDIRDIMLDIQRMTNQQGEMIDSIVDSISVTKTNVIKAQGVLEDTEKTMSYTPSLPTVNPVSFGFFKWLGFGRN